MSSLEIIRNEIKRLFDLHPDIRVNVSMTRPKVHLKNEPAVIRAVYPNFFRIEENSSGNPKLHTIQYTELLTNQIEIIEPCIDTSPKT